MYKFSKASLDKLMTCDPKLQRVVKRCMSDGEMDFTVIYGYRSPEKQLELFKAKKTKKDGYKKKSWHNYSPARAVDLVPYPIDWEDTSRFEALKKLMDRAATDEKVALVWGGDWKTLVDMPHYELARHE
jgi:peptidoglycan L-alanyl-D-glutamate endopeptidase CwlK